MRLKGLGFLKTWRGKGRVGEAEGHLWKPTPVLPGEAMGPGGELKEVLFQRRGLEYRAWSTQLLVLFVSFQLSHLMQFSVWLRVDS